MGVSNKQLEVDEERDKVVKLEQKHVNMVDKQLVKNLLVNYFSTPQKQREKVIPIIISMLGFSKEEESRITGSQQGWVTGWLWNNNKTPPSVVQTKTSEPPHQNGSFTEMLINFLETESKPSGPAAKLNATSMVNEQQQRMSQRKLAASGIPTPVSTPMTSQQPPKGPPSGYPIEKQTVAGRYNAPLVIPSMITTPSSGSSHPFIQPSLFTPAASGQQNNNTSGNVLQGILQQDNN